MVAGVAAVVLGNHGTGRHMCRMYFKVVDEAVLHKAVN